MTATLGHVTQLENGAFKGPLRTLNFRGDIDVAPLRDKASPAHPDYRVTCGGVEIGAGWIKVGGSAAPCARLILVHPDLGPRADRARSGPRADQGDDSVFALIRSPEGRARPRLAPLGAGALADRPSPQPRRRKRPPRWRAGAEDEADQR